MKFRDRIKLLRKERGMTQAQVAARLKKTEGAIRAWEGGNSKPDIDDVVTLAKYFDCTTDYLLGATDYRNPTDKEKAAAINSSLEKYISNISNGRELFSGLVQFLEAIPERDHQHITPAYLKIAKHLENALGDIYRFQENCVQTETFDFNNFIECYCKMSDALVMARIELNTISSFPLECIMSLCSKYGSADDYKMMKTFYYTHHHAHPSKNL